MKKYRQSSAIFIKKPSVVATQVALAVFAQFAYAQQAVQTAERVERIEVTGSRIPTVEAEGPSPITVMTQQEIRTDGLSKTEDLLNTLPQVFILSKQATLVISPASRTILVSCSSA